ncbi:MAG: hypothetical protein JNJ95_03825 [Dechloromonas sp.]|nr:hypothetical protein [Dechloromonas sp.]
MKPLNQLDRFSLASLSLLAALIALLVTEWLLNNLSLLTPWRRMGLPLPLGLALLSCLLFAGHRDRSANPPLTVFTILGSLLLFFAIGLPLWFFVACVTDTVCI